MNAGPNVSTIASAPARSNGVGVQRAHAGVRALHGGAPWPVRTAAAYALGSIGSAKALANALRRSRPTVSRMCNHGTTPVAEAAEVLYQAACCGLPTEPVLEVLRASAALGSEEHARRIAHRLAPRRSW